ncbi:MAG: hypothetical protein IKO22_06045 [Oscillospiraceae bacterium]|nr:hypothetical protein [Oscillospiraceae bacterium]
MLNLIVFLASLFLMIWISSKTKINLGVVALVFAFLIGIFLLDKSPASIFKSYFPTSVIANIIPAYIFFGAIGHTGATKVLAQKIGRKMHSNVKIVAVIMIYLVSIALTFGTAGGEGIRYAISAFAISLCLQLQIDPAIGVIVCWAGWQGTTNLPFSSLGSICTGIINENYPDLGASGVIILNLLLGLLFFTISMAGLYFVRGRKPFVSELADSDVPMNDKGEVEYNKEQSIAIKVLFTIVAILVIPAVIQLIAPNPVTKFLSSRLDVAFCFIMGSMILFLTKCANCTDVIKKDVNWGIIIMLAGACTLLSEAQPLGIVDTLNKLLATIPSFLIVPVVALVCGFLSMFVNGATLTPMFVPLAQGFSELAGVSLPFMIFVILSGFAVTGICPTSGGGAGSLSTVPGPLQSHVSKVMLRMTIIQMIGFAIFCSVLQLFF